MKLTLAVRSIKRVVCGISGGVDSAVSALLLKEKGYEVVGLFMRNWDIRDERGRCVVDEDHNDAQFVCDKLEIPLYDVDFVKQYWHEVFSDMLIDYQSGLTPNPDILCNRNIKFNHFLCYARDRIGADAIATGHYAKTTAGYELDTIDPAYGVSLLCSTDEWKDQTFFLSQIKQTALQKTIFPLGELLKQEVKIIACQAGLEKIAMKKESMGICFIGSRNFSNFIEDYIDPVLGNFIDIDTGQIVGTHKGIHYWTVGQRSRISGCKDPYYICKKQQNTNDILVAQGWGHPALFSETFIVGPIHWIRSPPLSLSESSFFEATFRFQHVHPLLKCSAVQTGNNRFLVKLSRPLRAITPGQFAVFYHNNECLGSGRILEVGPSLFQHNSQEKITLPKEFY